MYKTGVGHKPENFALGASLASLSFICVVAVNALESRQTNSHRLLLPTKSAAWLTMMESGELLIDAAADGRRVQPLARHLLRLNLLGDWVHEQYRTAKSSHAPLASSTPSLMKGLPSTSFPSIWLVPMRALLAPCASIVPSAPHTTI